MHLTKIEIQGFKTFAKKTSLNFLPPKNGKTPITAVIGPNGSGKSNLADAIRWVLGEQSLKLLRGKKSEDVIFSGAEGRSRSGFAEVSLTLDNTDKSMPVEFGEVTVSRRLYRDGGSEYMVNGSTARLSEIQLLLAEANVGQRSYSVIGQGMVDHILVSSPEERKAFFDDATGVKPLQLKRHEAMLKLKRTYENLAEAEMLLGEITPRLRSLKRQVSRLEKREEVENSLHDLEMQYYGTQWWQLQDRLGEVGEKVSGADKAIEEKKAELATLDEQVATMEKEEISDTKDQGLLVLQKEYSDKQRSRGQIRDQLYDTKKEIELAKVRAQSTWAPLPLTKIIEELSDISGNQRGLLEKVKEAKDMEEVGKVQNEINKILDRTDKLLVRLQRPAPEDIKTDPELIKKTIEFEKQLKEAEAGLKNLEEAIRAYATKEKKVKSEVFEKQRQLRAKQQEVHEAENKMGSVNIELARLEERKQNLRREIDEQTKNLSGEIRAKRPDKWADTENIYPEVQRLRYKLELIGGIDPEIINEFEEIKKRHEFLDGQVIDLRHGIKATEKIIDELDEEIRKQSEKAFKEINKEFQKYFKILFGGGSCSLVKMTKEETDKEKAAETLEEEIEHHENDTSIEAIKKRVKERQDRVVGINIQATPPGKKLKALNLLSGGERALASIALISAIMAVNPGPFVLLDEVDAALDEANTRRFAQILNDLAKLTQFIIITHNRATMEQADILYGVTMGDDGVSNLLSVQLSEIEETESARR